ncbi:DUF5753 domain-containing protein [Nonomuraea polychroma]|uniref:DUF5753 domain-containing protein n=1 Tax=Nonomuraea polychroma TaxID=46176 RepID=UPI003D8DBE27
MNGFAERLDTVMRQRQMSNHAAARALSAAGVKITPVYVGHLRKGDRVNPTVAVAAALAQLLDVPVGWLIAGEDALAMQTSFGAFSEESQDAIGRVIALARRADGLVAGAPRERGLLRTPAESRPEGSSEEWAHDLATHPYPAQHVRQALSPVSDDALGAAAAVGARLRVMREAVDVSVDEAGLRAAVSGELVAAAEAGRLRLSPSTLTNVLVAYGVTDPYQQQLFVSASRGDFDGKWWFRYFTTLPLWVLVLIQMEDRAELIKSYHNDGIIPPLLQHEEYARAVRQAAHYPEDASDQVDFAVRLVLERQAQLLGQAEEGTVRLWTVVDECTLLHTVGGVDVQIAQINHLIDLSKMNGVTIQVNRGASGRYYPRGGSFQILRDVNPSRPDVVWVPQLSKDVLVDDAETVGTYAMAHARLAMSAVSPERTVSALTEVRDLVLKMDRVARRRRS